MDNFMQPIALLETSLTCAVLMIWLIQKMMPFQIPVAARIIFAILLANLFFWPLGFSMALPLAAYVRGITGDLSVVTSLLLWSSVLYNPKAIPLSFKWSIAVIAAVFYPLALGVGMMDPYAWGYGSIGLLIAVLIFAVACGVANWTRGVWILAIAIIAWSVHWHESTNLWDYLLDPFLAIWALWRLFMQLVKNEKRRLGLVIFLGLVDM